MTIVIESNSKLPLSRRRTAKILNIGLFVTFALIPVAILLFYGIEDKTAWFFGHDYINDYRYRIDGVVHNIGIMVGHFALIATVSIVGILISWIIIEGLKESNVSINRIQSYFAKNSEDYVISR